MYVEEETRRRFEFPKPLANEHSIRAQVDVLPAAENLTDKPAQIGIDHGLAPADGHDWRTAFVQRRQALLDGELFLDGIRVFANAPATRAGEIARMQGLQHHDKWKFLSSAQALACDVGRHARSQSPGKSHKSLPGRNRSWRIRL